MSLVRSLPPRDAMRASASASAVSSGTAGLPGVPGPNPADAEGLRERVDLALAAFLDTQGELLASISPELTPVLDVVRDFVLDGGKRLRAAFLYWGWRCAGGPAHGPEADGAVRAAAALELLQASALVHDDLMDHSDTRRGRPAMHRRFETRHRAEARQGDAARYGGATAVLVGDLLLAWCDTLFTDCGLPWAAVRRAKPVLDVLRTEVTAGQYLDMLDPVATVGDVGPDALVERARTVIRYKAAKYTVERPLQLGAVLAGAPEPLVAALGRFGLPLGEAFQLRDDLLGVYGDPAVTGKPNGDDLREGKRTVLLAEARRGSAADVRTVESLLGQAGLDAAGVETLRAAIARTGAVERVEQRIAGLHAEALAALGARGIAGVGAEALRRLADAAVVRRR